MNNFREEPYTRAEIEDFFVPGRMLVLKIGVGLGPPGYITAKLAMGESIFVLSPPKIDSGVISFKILTVKGIFVFSLHETWNYPDCLDVMEKKHEIYQRSV